MDTHRGLFISCILFALIFACHAQNACRINPCLNGGSCREALLSPYYVCLCIGSWIGQDCEKEFPRKNCGGNSYTETGNITSPNYPNSHGYNERCLYLVRVPEAETITFNFNHFESEENKDELYIAIGPDFIDYNDVDPDNLPEGYIRLHGGPLFIEPMTFNTNSLTLLWDSDRNIIRPGFHIYYTRETDPCWMNQCQNGAECQAINGEQYECRCLVGWSGMYCSDGAILVRQTSNFLISGSPLIEGRNNHIVTFNLAIFPDLAVSYNVIGTNLWTISVYLSNQQDGQGERIAETVAPLSSEQMSASWIPPNTMNIGNVQTLINLDMVTCQDMWYLCASINRGMNPSTVFYMEGSPTNASLTGCTTVSCTGVRILNTGIVWKSQNDLREGFTQQNVQFDIKMTPDPAGGSVTGINLWRVLLFGNINAQGSGERVREQEIPIVEPNSRRSIQAGVQTTLSDLTTTINMQGLKCEEIPYICVEILPGPNADPSFTLTGDLMSCYQIPCRGTNIIGTSFEIDIGNPLVERSGQHDITFDLLLLPDPTGGAAIGSNLWAVSLFATSGSSTDRVSPTVQVALSSFQSGTSLRPPGTSRVSNVQTSLNLEGRLCSELFAVCAVLTKGPFATPDYTFETAPGDPALTACTNVECQAECTDQYACHDGLLCISFRRVCDGYPDCTDNSDELPLTCAYYRTTTEVPSDYQTTEAATYTPGDSYLSPLIVIVTSAIGGVILVIIILCIARIVLRRKKKLTASMLTALEEISTPQLTLSTMNSTFEGEEDDIDLSPAFLDPAGESTDVSFENPLYGESNA